MPSLDTVPAEVRLNIYEQYLKIQNVSVRVESKLIPNTFDASAPKRRHQLSLRWIHRFCIHSDGMENGTHTTFENGLDGVSKTIRGEFIAFMCSKQSLQLPCIWRSSRTLRQTCWLVYQTTGSSQSSLSNSKTTPGYLYSQSDSIPLFRC